MICSRKAQGACLLALGAALALAGGCGSASYSYHAVRAARSYEVAKQLDAHVDAPYEQTIAEAYLKKAREESSEAQYQDAIKFAKRSQAMADKAVEISRRRRQGESR